MYDIKKNIFKNVIISFLIICVFTCNNAYSKYLNEGRLFIFTKPYNSNIRILNIRPVFHQGIRLKFGKYHIEVSKKGYFTTKLWIKIAHRRAKIIEIKLLKNAIVKISACTSIRKKAKIISLNNDDQDQNSLQLICSNYFTDNTDNKNDTITNKTTGLIWQKDESDKKMNIRDALCYIFNLNFNKYRGFDDWRLPTFDELLTITFLDGSLNCKVQKEFNSHNDYVFLADKLESGKNYPFNMNSCGKIYIICKSNDDGKFECDEIEDKAYVRAVRTIQKEELIKDLDQISDNSTIAETEYNIYDVTSSENNINGSYIESKDYYEDIIIKTSIIYIKSSDYSFSAKEIQTFKYSNLQIPVTIDYNCSLEQTIEQININLLKKNKPNLYSMLSNIPKEINSKVLIKDGHFFEKKMVKNFFGNEKIEKNKIKVPKNYTTEIPKYYNPNSKYEKKITLFTYDFEKSNYTKYIYEFINKDTYKGKKIWSGSIKFKDKIIGNFKMNIDTSKYYYNNLLGKIIYFEFPFNNKTLQARLIH